MRVFDNSALRHFAVFVEYAQYEAKGVIKGTFLEVELLGVIYLTTLFEGALET